MDTEGRPLRAAAASSWPGRELLIFIGGAVLTLLLVSLGSVLIGNQVARTNALRNAETVTARLADLVVGPLLGEALSGNAVRRDELDQAVLNRLRDGSIIGIYVWRADGEIVYASDPDVIGQRFAPPAEVTEVVQHGGTLSATDDGSSDEPQGPANSQGQRVVEVYVPLQLDGQPPLVFEAYYSYGQVEQQAGRLLAQIVPLCVGALVLLQLIQIPIVVRLARRVAGHKAERAELLEQALSASDRERRQIAADLHDGLIQDLAGAGYALAVLTRSVPPERTAAAERVGEVVRGAVDSLRRLMVDIYPPDLSGAGLAVAVQDLAKPLREQGVTVSIDVTSLPPLDPVAATTLYRVAREALTNVAKHAKASTVQVCLTAEHIARCDSVLLRVIDDGVGLPLDALNHRAEGHLGLRLLIDRIADLGGELTVHRVDDRGTVIEAHVPVRDEG